MTAACCAIVEAFLLRTLRECLGFNARGFGTAGEDVAVLLKPKPDDCAGLGGTTGIAGAGEGPRLPTLGKAVGLP